MPYIDITDPKVVNYYTENFEKTKKLRLLWFLKNREAVERAASFSGESKCYKRTDVIKHKLIEHLPTLSRDYSLYAVNRRKKTPYDMKMPQKMLEVKPYSEKLPELEAKSALLINMCPVDKKLNKILYEPKPKYGRVRYLKERNKIDPENKYYLTECDSWKYGWRLKDSKLAQNRAQHGRHCAFMWELKGRGRFGPDPPHYNEIALESMAIKCL